MGRSPARARHAAAIPEGIDFVANLFVFVLLHGQLSRMLEHAPSTHELPQFSITLCQVPADQAALKTAVKCDPKYQTWTDTAGDNEQLPMNCLNWYTAFAFCAWDGGRLPTEAEWNYAAAGGIEQRVYPWGDTAPDATYAVYDCLGDGSAAGTCAFADILKAGSKSPKGDGKWGQADLGGSMWEWNLDWSQVPYANTKCMNCANISQGTARVVRGAGWVNKALDLASSNRYSNGPTHRINNGGARCARTP